MQQVAIYHILVGVAHGVGQTDVKVNLTAATQCVMMIPTAYRHRLAPFSFSSLASIVMSAFNTLDTGHPFWQ